MEWTLEDQESQEMDAYSNNDSQEEHTSQFHDGSSTTNTSIAYLLLDISNTLVVVNAASPFIVCLLYCKGYRKYFWKYCTTLCCRIRKPEVGQMIMTSSSNWSSYVLRPFSTSMENFTAIMTTDFRSRANTRKRSPRSLTIRRVETEPELQRLHEKDTEDVSYVNGLIILDRDVIRRSAVRLRIARTPDDI